MTSRATGWVRRSLLGIAIVQILSTQLGFWELLFMPQWFEPMLRGTAFEGQFVVPALLLGIVVGGPQWCAAWMHWKRPTWLYLAHAAAGTVMVGWIAGECLILDSFMWAHAVWGGLGFVQVLLVLIVLDLDRSARLFPARHGALVAR